jgi:hypothetical protein
MYICRRPRRARDPPVRLSCPGATRCRAPGGDAITPILLGTQLYDATGDARRRQDASVERLLGLAGAAAVNVQFADGAFEDPRLETLPVLRRDSRTVTGLPGRRKPIASEVCGALATIARRRGLRYFGYLNGDILVDPPAVAQIHALGRETYAFSRLDVDRQGAELGVVTAGLDLFVFDVAWWERHQGRFRPYVLGECVFDNVYASVMMCHSNGAIVNRAPGIRHERHESAAGGPFADYNWYLASLDSRYFSLWVAYWEQLTAARARGASEAEEEAICRQTFVWRSTPAAWAVQAGRSIKARVRFARQRRAWRRRLSP